MMIQKILFPVDFSPSCTAMASFVKRAAEMFSAKVTLLYVLSPSPSGFELLVRPMREVESDLEHCAQTKLDSYLEAELPARDHPRLLLVGDPATRITEAVREHGFDLIVMPTHAGAFRRTLLGSTTAKVLNDADCPVLTSRHAETISPRPLEHREWVCAIGLQADSERVLRYASRAAESVHANLTLVHVIPASGTDSAVRSDSEGHEQSAEKVAARNLMEKLRQKVGSHALVRVVIGPMKDALTDAACRWQADALIIGRSPQPGSLGRLHDLTYAVVRDAPCPVLSV
jgi:nucleotide-binding universal stress UspA family protein